MLLPAWSAVHTGTIGRVCGWEAGLSVCVLASALAPPLVGNVWSVALVQTQVLLHLILPSPAVPVGVPAHGNTQGLLQGLQAALADVVRDVLRGQQLLELLKLTVGLVDRQRRQESFTCYSQENR